MNGITIGKLLGVLVSATVACASSAQAQGVTEREIEGIDKRFAIASEQFGESEVQLHTRADTDTGSVHEIYTFDCEQKTYRKDYADKSVPESFPIAGAQGESFTLVQEMEENAIAAHVCKEHGFSWNDKE